MRAVRLKGHPDITASQRELEQAQNSGPKTPPALDADPSAKSTENPPILEETAPMQVVEEDESKKSGCCIIL